MEEEKKEFDFENEMTTHRKRLYQLLEIADETERENMLEQIANDYATYGQNIYELERERDKLSNELEMTTKDRDVYKSRLRKIVSKEIEEQTLNEDEKDNDLISKIFIEREDKK